MNEQYLVEEIYEREFAQARGQERENEATDSQERRPLLHSIEDHSYDMRINRQ